MKYIDINKLETLMQDILKQNGVSAADSAIIARVLAAADRLGFDTHGISRLKKIYIDRIRMGIVNPVTTIEIISDKEGSTVLDGHNGMGHVISEKAIDIAIEKASKYGISISVVRNSSHFGIAGYYSLKAVQNNMIGITGTNARPSMAPIFGNENTVGTNPLTFGIPSDDDFPFLLDCATSVSQRGKVELYAREGKPIPEGWVTDPEGNYLTNPEQILSDLLKDKASFVPVGGNSEETGGYKGFGYGTVVEILSAALQNGNYLKMLSGFDEKGNKIPYNLGHFFIVIDIAHFIEPSVFKAISGSILRTIRNSRRLDENQRIYTPGEKEYLTRIERERDGVPLTDELMNEIEQMCSNAGLDLGNYIQ